MSAGQSATYSYTVTLDDGTALPNGTALLTDLDFGALDGNPPRATRRLRRASSRTRRSRSR
jgi:hypothetical protein